MGSRRWTKVPRGLFAPYFLVHHSDPVCAVVLFAASMSPPEALSEQPGALELKQVLINLAVDFGVLAAAAFGFNVET